MVHSVEWLVDCKVDRWRQKLSLREKIDTNIELWNQNFDELSD